MTPEPTAPRHQSRGRPADAGDFLLERRLRICRTRLPARREVMVDYGCGNGAQTLRLAGEFGAVHGLDVDPGHLADFRRGIEGEGLGDRVFALRFPGAEVPLADGFADLVVSFTVLEHVPDQELALREMRRILKPGGRLILSVPNKWWIFETHGADLPLLPWNRVPLVSWWPRALHDRYARARIYRRREIARLVRDAGFDVVETFRMTAPMDVVPWDGVKRVLRRTVFGPDTTPVPFLATEVFVVADRP